MCPSRCWNKFDRKMAHFCTKRFGLLLLPPQLMMVDDQLRLLSSFPAVSACCCGRGRMQLAHSPTTLKSERGKRAREEELDTLCVCQ